MIRPFPRSLFGRMALILVAGMIVALVVAAAINFHEHQQMMRQTDAMRQAMREHMIEHFATTAKFIDLVPAGSQAAAIHLLGNQYCSRVDIGAPPAAATIPASAQPFMHALSAELGTRYLVRFAFVGKNLQPLAPNESQAANRNLIAVRLSDGKWLRFFSLNHHHMGRHHHWHWSPTFLIELAVVLAIVIAFSLFALWRAIRPLSMLAGAARNLGRDIRHVPLGETGPTEVRRAAIAFNLMQRKLLGFIEGRIRLLTAISHDLKTPVTRLRLRAEMLEDKALAEDINRDLDEMDDMLQATLAYLRGEAEREPVQPLDVNALLESMTADAQALGQPVTLAGHANSPYPARPRALRRAVENLAQNALRYAGNAEITLVDKPRALEIRIADRGPGIPEDELEQVFEPFYRVEASRNRATGGTGLGLAIAREVAEAHGGTLSLANRAGGGLVATLTLPR